VGAPQPEEIFERTRVEGKRRLERPTPELVSTALAAGLDIVFGVIVLAVVTSLLSERIGHDPSHFVGSIAFGIGFVFLIVGRGELFTENFLVPIAGLERKRRRTWWKLAELWTVSPFVNLVAGAGMVALVTTHGVLPRGSGAALVRVAEDLHSHHPLSLFLSAVVGGALITAMTWFVEGSDSTGVRITIAWIAGAFLALGGFNHAIVATLELIAGIRYGADISWLFVLGNFGLAAAGNMVGGVLLVTLNRFTQAGVGTH